MRHGRPINARGPNVSISITLPPHKIRPFLPSLGWRPYSMLVKKFENLSNFGNFPKIVFVFGEHPLPCCVFSSFFGGLPEITVFCCLHDARGKVHKFSFYRKVDGSKARGLNTSSTFHLTQGHSRERHVSIKCKKYILLTLVRHRQQNMVLHHQQNIDIFALYTTAGVDNGERDTDHIKNDRRKSGGTLR